MWKELVLLVMVWKNCRSQECPNGCFCSTTEDSETSVKLVSCSGTLPEIYPPNVNHLVILYAQKKILQKSDTTKMGQIRKLDLIGLYTEVISQGTFSVKNFENLTSLRLSDNRIRNLDSDTFETLINLQELYLDNNIIETVHQDTFVNLVNLNSLHLQNNLLKEIPDLPQNLSELNLCNNAIQNLTLLQKNIKLISLDLCGNKFRTILKEEVFIPQTLENLCIGNMLEDIDPEIFHSKNNLKYLKVNTTGKINMTALSAINFLTELKSLSVSTPNLSALSTFTFTNLKKLRSISLVNTVTSTSLNKDFFNSFHNLTELDISNSTNLAPQIINNINFQMQLADLKILRARNTGLTSFPDISTSFTKLRELDISNNPIKCHCSLLSIAQKFYTGNLSFSKNSSTKCYDENTTQYYNILSKHSTSFICKKKTVRESKEIQISEESEDIFTIIFDDDDEIPTQNTPHGGTLMIYNDMIYLIMTLIFTIALVFLIMFCIHRKRSRGINRSRMHIFTIF